MGKMIEVEIIECGKHSMKAKIIRDTLDYPLRPIGSKRGDITGLKEMSDLNNNENNISCCGSCDCSEEKEVESGCCSNKAETSCCSTKTGSNLLNNNRIVYQDSGLKGRFREYAYATLIATSAILISRIALKYLYSNK